MAEQTEYTVEWLMGITANDPIDAARQALAIHRDPESIATVFFVGDGTTRIKVDMEDVEGFEEWTQLDYEDVAFFPAFTAWMNSGQASLAEWWADNQGAWV